MEESVKTDHWIGLKFSFRIRRKRAAVGLCPDPLTKLTTLQLDYKGEMGRERKGCKGSKEEGKEKGRMNEKGRKGKTGP